MLELITRKEARERGLKRFFTGIECVNGHISPYATVNGTCCECVRSKAWLRYVKKTVMSDRINAQPLNRKTAIEFGLVNYNTGEPCKRGHFSDRRVSDKKCRECIKIKDKIRRDKNPEYMRVAIKNCKLKRRGVEGTFSKKDIDLILGRQKNKCASCKKYLIRYHVDHIMPLSKGGTNYPSNLQCLCPSCNLKKSSKHPIAWARENGMLI